MTWFKLDDQFHDHPKVLAAGNAAIGLYCRLGCYCADKLTDGFIPAAVARSMGTAKEMKALTVCPIPDTRPLLAVVDGGYQMVDFLEYNPTREKVLAERAKAKERMAEGRSRSAEVRANNRANFARSSLGPEPVPEPLVQVSGNSTPENTGEGGDNSKRNEAIERFARMELDAAKAKGTSIRTESGFLEHKRKDARANPDLDRWLVMFPSAPASAVAGWLAGDKHSMGYYERVDEPLADVVQLRKEAM